MTSDSDGPARPECPSVLPGEDGWEAARQAWNVAADQHPAAVAHPETAEDVVAAVRFARARGLRVAAQCTGHAAAELDPLDDALLVRTANLRELEIDPEARRARVGAGLQWAEVAEAAAAHGLAGPAGSSGTVGVVGYTLGGGNGWLGRRHGLACNGVSAVELVTADGELRRVDAASDPELFWALRGGGGGNFGVVTAIEFALHPVAEVEMGFLLWPVQPGPRGAARLVGDHRRAPGGGLHHRPGPQPAAARGAAPVPARPRAGGGGGGRHPRAGRARRPARAAAGARPRDGHGGARAGAGAREAAHGPRGPRARHLRRRPARRGDRRHARRHRRPDGARLRVAAPVHRAAPAGRRPRLRARRRRRRLAPRMRRGSSSAWASRPDPRPSRR